jgi:hypothetical protein
VDSISAIDLLETWERGLGGSPVERALAVAAMALPDRTLDELGQMSIGTRDRLIMSIRESAFGRRLTGLADCPSCGAHLELDLDVAEMRGDAGGSADDVDIAASRFSVRVRLPNSFDQRAAAAHGDASVSRRALLDRCLVAATRDGEPVLAADLPEPIVGEIAGRLAEADPGADVLLDAACPDCGRAWSISLDIVSYFWGEIEGWAARLLNDVHTLASAYGWAERDILALSPARRQFYLEAVSG